MPQLSDRDEVFLRKAQRTSKGLAIVAVANIMIPLVGWLVLTVRGPQLAERLVAISTPLTERLDAENASLRNLKPVTPLEQELVDKLQQRNELAAGLSGTLSYTPILAIIGTTLTWLFAFGLFFAAEARQHRRYLQIIDALREDVS